MADLTPSDLRVGDTLERRIAPFTVASVRSARGGWDGQQPLVKLTSTTGESLTYHVNDRITVPVTREG